MSSIFRTNYIKCFNSFVTSFNISTNRSVVISKMPFYAVANGRSCGIYQTWAECESQVKGFKGAKFKKFNTQDEAMAFVTGSSVPSSSSANQKTTNFPNNAYKIFTNQNAYKTNSKPNFYKSAAVKSVSATKNKQFHTKSTDDFNVEDLESELMKKMDEIEKNIGVIKTNVFGKESKKKAIMIDALPIQEPQVASTSSCAGVKRPNDAVSHGEAKKMKTMNVAKGKDQYNFMMDEAGFVQVYTDGACSNNGYKGAQAGLGVYFGEGHPLNVSEPVSGRATNNCGEIQAATRAIRVAHSMGISKLNIKTDSKFVINSITQWIHGWKRKGWKLSNGEPVKNETDFKDLDAAQRLLEVKWEYVSGHKGIHGNEMADRLAKAGAARYKPDK